MAANATGTLHRREAGRGRVPRRLRNNRRRRPAVGMCPAGSVLPDPASMPMWNGWGNDATNTRFQDAKAAGLTAAHVPKLTLKWAFGFPGVTSASGQPTVAAGRVFVGNVNGMVYSLDAKTGCTHWTFKADGGVRTAISVARCRRRRAAHNRDVRRHPRQRLRASTPDRARCLEEEGRRPCLRAHHRRTDVCHGRSTCRSRRRGSLRRARQLCVLHLPRQRGRARRRDRQADLEDAT